MIKRINRSRLDKETLSQIKVDEKVQKNDFFDYSKVVVKKPWGYEYLIYENGLVSVWILQIKKGFRTSMHCHPNKKTSLIVLAGEVVCSTLDKDIKRKTGQGLFIEKEVFHSTKAVSDEKTYVMEIETPINKRDLIRLKDNYGRVGKGYETIKDMSFDTQNYNYISLIEPEVFYNVKKKFGKCSISLAKFRDYKDFNENFRLEGWDAICILKGQIFDEKDNVIVDTGDTIDLETLRPYKNIRIDKEIEIIIVNKSDNMIKISDYIVNYFEKNNLNRIFVVPGSSNVHLLDSVGRRTEITHIQTQTEQAATTAAEAYAKLTGKPAVVMISSGYSASSCLSGVADSWIDSTPLIVISGQCQTEQSIDGRPLRQLGIQELNIVDMVKPITKYAAKVNDPAKIKYHLEKAKFLATDGRPGPVWLDIPIDIQGMIADEKKLTSFSQKREEHLHDLIDLQIKETIKMINKYKRPVIIAGNGIRLSGAVSDFAKLIEELKIPVLMSLRGADLIPGEHPLCFGRHGAYGQRSANFIVQNSDLIISIGSRLALPQIGRNYKAFARNAKKVVVDIDKNELEKGTVNPDIAVCASARTFINKLTEKLEYIKKNDISEWLRKCNEWTKKYGSSPYKKSGKGSVNPYFFMETLSETLKNDDLIAIDGGSLLIFAMQSFLLKPGQRLLTATGLNNPSFALAGSIGAGIALDGRNIIAVCEDKGFQKNIQELETIIKYKIPVKIFVLNNRGYSYIRKTQKEYFGRRYVGTEDPESVLRVDLVKIGESYGVKSFSISDENDLENEMRQILELEEPVICEIKIDREQQITPRIVFNVKPDGKWIAKPLEDMYPFLGREELKENMMIDLLEEDES